MTLRAHLATSPLRHAQMLEVVDAIAPHVDVLHVCLNGYPSTPRELARHANVKPTIPPRDLMGAGRFLPSAFPDDRVLLLGDGILYPADYVPRLMDFGDRIGLEENAVGFDGVAVTARGVQRFVHRRRLGAVRGVGQLGASTAMLLGKHLPPLSRVEPAKEWVDIRLATHLAEIGVKPWALPRQAGWLKVAKGESGSGGATGASKPDQWRAEQVATLSRFDHMGMRLRDYRAAAKSPPRRIRIVRA